MLYRQYLSGTVVAVEMQELMAPWLKNVRGYHLKRSGVIWLNYSDPTVSVCQIGFRRLAPVRYASQEECLRITQDEHRLVWHGLDVRFFGELPKVGQQDLQLMLRLMALFTTNPKGQPVEAMKNFLDPLAGKIDGLLAIGQHPNDFIDISDFPGDKLHLVPDAILSEKFQHRLLAFFKFLERCCFFLDKPD